MIHQLMIKTHNETGLKYLCYTKKTGEAYDNYKGSGVLWKKHLKKHGDDISTELLLATEDYNLFQKTAIELSHKYNIVESSEWANLKIEEGDGGDTVSNRMWISKDGESKYHYKDQPLPEGWVKGRANCKFNDPKFQDEMRSRSHADPDKKREGMKRAWAEGRVNRDHSKCGAKGDDNVSKRPDVRKKLSEAAKNKPMITCPHCGKEGKQSPGMYAFHFDNCKAK